MIAGELRKQPWERFDVDVDFRTALSELSPPDTIDTIAVMSDSTDLVVSSGGTLGGFVKAWIEGGLNGKRYVVTYRVTTLGGRKIEAEVIVKVKEVK